MHYAQKKSARSCSQLACLAGVRIAAKKPLLTSLKIRYLTLTIVLICGSVNSSCSDDGKIALGCASFNLAVLTTTHENFTPALAITYTNIIWICLFIGYVLLLLLLLLPLLLLLQEPTDIQIRKKLMRWVCARGWCVRRGSLL